MQFSFAHYYDAKNINIFQETLNHFKIAYKEIHLCLQKYRSKQVIWGNIYLNCKFWV